jgi:hypothetical protein
MHSYGSHNGQGRAIIALVMKFWVPKKNWKFLDSKGPCPMDLK